MKKIIGLIIIQASAICVMSQTYPQNGNVGIGTPIAAGNTVVASRININNNYSRGSVTFPSAAVARQSLRAMRFTRFTYTPIRPAGAIARVVTNNNNNSNPAGGGGDPFSNGSDPTIPNNPL